MIDVIDWNAMMNLSIPLAFSRSIFSHPLRICLLPEIIILALIMIIQIISAVFAWYSSPTQRTITKLFSTLTSVPYVNIVMPIYNEPLPSLMAAVNSIVDSKYPADRIELLMAFDDHQQTNLYLSTIYCLTHHVHNTSGSISKTEYENIEENIQHLKKTESMNIDYPDVFIIEYRGIKITICRFPHGGKRHVQECAFHLLRKHQITHSGKRLLLYIDSDIVLDNYAIHMLAWEFVKPLSKKNCRPRGVTGLILCKTKGNYSILTALQDAEYIAGQTFIRQLEHFLGSVTCLPGALTMMSFDAFENVSAEYFNNDYQNHVFNFARMHLGEDRYLTHLLMRHAQTYGATAYQSAARCETEAVSSFAALLKQRRRWWLGGMTNLMSMYTDLLLWKSYTSLILIRIFQYLTSFPSLLLYILFMEFIIGH